jgi:CBS domain-containing protein
MPLNKEVKEIMIPIEKYSVVDPEATLRDAVLSLRRSYCRIENGFCAETGPRTILVVDPLGDLVGLLDFRSLLKVLVPEVAGKLSQRLAALEVSIVFLEGGAEQLDPSQENLAARVLKNAEVRVKEVMQKSLGNISADTKIIEALKMIFIKKVIVLPVYYKERLVGIVRDIDLFLYVADIIRE